MFDFPSTPTVGQQVSTPNGGFSWDGVKWVPLGGIGAGFVLRSYLAGLTLSTAGSSATFSVAPGVAVDSTNAAMMTLGAALSKTNAAWAVGSGAGALDTGAIANNTWYHVHLIERTDLTAVDVLVSLSATAPTMPANYTFFRRIGSMKTNASGQWIRFLQIGDYFEWDVAVNDTGSAPTTTAANVTLSGIPTGLKIMADVTIYANSSVAPSLFVWDPDTTGGSNNYWIVVPVANAMGTVRANTMTSTAAQIRWQISTGTVGTIGVYTIGWTDRRGRDA